MNIITVVISAIGKANHVASNPTYLPSTKASGNTSAICLKMLWNIDLVPIPTAVNIAVKIIDAAAGMKHKLAYLNALIPIAYMFSLALNSDKSCSGKSKNTNVPIIIIANATNIA